MNPRIYKLKKQDLKTPETLLNAVKVVNGNRAYPETVYVSKKDYEILRKNTEKYVKKQATYRLDKNKIKSYTDMKLLNLGPNTCLADIIKPGFVVVIE